MREYKWGVFVLGWAVVDLCSWQLGLPLYLGVQLGGILIFVSGVL